jgi:hypothetical protein
VPNFCSTPAPIGVNVLAKLGGAVGAVHVELGIGVATLGIEQGRRRHRRTDARADIEVAVGLDVTDAEALEVAFVELGLGGRIADRGFRADYQTAKRDIVTGLDTVHHAIDRLVVIDIGIVIDAAAGLGNIVAQQDPDARPGERRIRVLRERRDRKKRCSRRENQKCFFHDMLHSSRPYGRRGLAEWSSRGLGFMNLI